MPVIASSDRQGWPSENLPADADRRMQGQSRDAPARMPGTPLSNLAQSTSNLSRTKERYSQNNGGYSAHFPNSSHKRRTPHRAVIWESYVVEATDFDERMIKTWREGMDILLVFAALFSAVVTAFLILYLPSLSADSSQATVDALIVISQQLATLTSGEPIAAPFEQLPASAPSSVIWMIALWFVSLGISLSVSVYAMLVKQWLTAYTEDLSSETYTRATQRHFRYIGLRRWRLTGIAKTLTILIHLAVVLFGSGVAVLLYSLHCPELAIMVVALLAMMVFLYFMSALMPAFIHNCPYRSPMSAPAKALLRPFKSCFPRATLDRREKEEEVIKLRQREIELGALKWLRDIASKSDVRDAAVSAMA